MVKLQLSNDYPTIKAAYIEAAKNGELHKVVEIREDCIIFEDDTILNPFLVRE